MPKLTILLSLKGHDSVRAIELESILRATNYEVLNLSKRYKLSILPKLASAITSKLVSTPSIVVRVLRFHPYHIKPEFVAV